MTILITGICGFVGSVIARRLLESKSDLKIVGIDNLCRRGSETNLAPLRALGIEVCIGDIRNAHEVSTLPRADWVIDCAANPSVLAGVDGKTSAKELLDHNLGGTIHLLEYCRHHGAGFLLLSTSRVYSIKPLAKLSVEVVNHAFTPIAATSLPGFSPKGLSEAFSTEPPISLYGASKKCSEVLALEYGSTFQFPVRINRCGVLAGAGQFGKADQGIFSFWIHSWAARRPLKYLGFGGHGSQVRDCLHPTDLVPVLLRQMENPGHSAPAILNFSGGLASALSLAQLSQWCTEYFGPLPEALDPALISGRQPSRPFDLPWIVLDSSLAEQAWNWTPEISCVAILEEIANHTKTHPDWLNTVA